MTEVRIIFEGYGMRHEGKGTRTIKYVNTISGAIALLPDVAMATVTQQGPLYEYCRQNGITIVNVVISSMIDECLIKVTKTWGSVVLIKPGEETATVDIEAVEPSAIAEELIRLSGIPKQNPRFDMQSECVNPELLGYGSLF